MRSADGVAGGREGARDFPGANRMLLNGTGPQITTNRMTVSAWAHPDAGTSNVNIVGRWNGALATNSWLLNCCPVEAGIGDAGGQDVATGVLSYPKGGPLLHHYCFTKGPSTLEFCGVRVLATAASRFPSIQHSSVDVIAVEIGLPAIAVELRRKDLAGQDRREEQRVAVEGLQHQLLRGLGRVRAGGDLFVVLGLHRLGAGCGAPIAPCGFVQEAAQGAQFVGGQDIRDVKQHGDEGWGWT